MKRILSGLTLFALALSGWAQVSSAPPLLNYKGTALPSTCQVGRLFFDTDATAGSNVYGCTSANTWTLQGASGAGVYLPLAGGTMTGNILFTDNTYDIGASGATRPRNLYLGGVAIINGSDLYLGSSGGTQSIVSATADGRFKLTNAAGNDFSRLQLGGTTSSFPAIKRSAATVAFRLADDSADAAITAASVADSKGDVRILPQNAQTSNYTLVLADAGKHIYHASGDGAGDTYTIPANASVAFTVGTMVSFVNLDSNAVSIAITSDTMYLGGVGTTGTRTLAQYCVATAVKVASTSWIINGGSCLT